MSTTREGPNPLRPYYKPPSIGVQADTAQNASSVHNIGAKQVPTSSPQASLGTSARDILSDLDYSEYLSGSAPSATEVIKGVVDQAIWKYTSVLLAQPFEVAKLVLQVQHAGGQLEDLDQVRIAEKYRRRPGSYREEEFDIPSDEDSPDERDYFTSGAFGEDTPSRSRPRRRKNERHSSTLDSPPSPLYASSPLNKAKRSPGQSHRLAPTTSLTTVVSHLWTTEGAWGIWKGTNSTFIHSVLVSTLTSFARSLICALLGLPDPGLAAQASSPTLAPMFSAVGGLDVLSSSSPLASLFAAVGAAGLAGVVFAPLDIARTKLMLTPSTHPPRSLLPTLQSLPSWTLPLSIAPGTIMNSILPTLIAASIPLFLRSKLGVDPLLTPNAYAVATFVSQAFELGVRLPIETVLRRGQMAIISTPSLSTSSRSSKTTLSSSSSSSSTNTIETIVEIGPYHGLVGTMYSIVFEEGERTETKFKPTKVAGTVPLVDIGLRDQPPKKRRKGQGIQGLWRGWRVGMWGLVGVWSATTLGAVGGKGGEF